MKAAYYASHAVMQVRKNQGECDASDFYLTPPYVRYSDVYRYGINNTCVLTDSAYLSYTGYPPHYTKCPFSPDNCLKN